MVVKYTAKTWLSGVNGTAQFYVDYDLSGSAVSAMPLSLTWRCQRHRRVFTQLFQHHCPVFTPQYQQHRRNQARTEPNRHWACQLLNLSITELVRYRTSQIPNLSDTELIRYRTYQIRTFQIWNLPIPELHSKNFCHGRIIICTLHRRHLQICFSLILIWSAWLKV
jgi:hypothetical protein